MQLWDFGGQVSTGHTSVLALPNGEYSIVYHRWAISGGDGNHREICIDKMRFNADGTIAGHDGRDRTTLGRGAPPRGRQARYQIVMGVVVSTIVKQLEAGCAQWIMLYQNWAVL